MGSQGGAIQEPKNGSLARQGSLYNLTLDEVHNQLGNLGKPLGSMNLDELLKGVWTAESGTDAYMQQGQVAYAGSSLNPQGSLTLCGDLSKKTIDEVWRDMQQKKSVSQERERQPTLGEMTLEDFLVKAGVTTDPFPNDDSAMAMPGVDSQHNTSQHAHWLQYQLTSVQEQPQQQHHQHQNQQNTMMPGFSGFMAVQQPMPVVVNPVLDAGYSEAMPSSLMGALSDSQSAGRKRAASGNVVEKTVERRQKRMIKNRESAARSRARKQAYTQELEIKVSRLEEENERLRRQNEIEKVLPSAPPPDPKHQLRRTSSAPL
ncbi:ABSCISIC ACID-INSENSITIVE 5-like protein [Vigna angularis]|uniref:ABSCISIC ACID-INSENSITIVE 5-like protein n=1 Tax=Phaseolus angularis TaxID=3914 RepID=A0A8T0L3B7_PHAAN|nr:ABSCISIC ACID-INSENSITIVE 5-like protein 2 [Vigna angularis]KAG2405468.1 ABSCISIC ACID-INSENSITIVE 5-like protein [Vigna angularis]